MNTSPFGQNSFGTPNQAPTPVPEPERESGGNRRKLLLIGGLGGLTVLVLAAGAALTLGSSDDALDGGLATGPAPVAAPTTSPTTTTPAPLPTVVDLNGRNPFKAKIVPASGGAGGGDTADGGSPAAGGGVEPTTAPGGGGSGTTTTVFVPGPTVTKTVQVPGPTTTTPGPTRTVYLMPGAIELTYLGTDLPDPAPEDFVPDDPTLADFEINGDVIQDVKVGDTFAYYFQLLELKQDDETDEAHLRFGDAMGWVTKDQTEKF
jgi:hypothetical protein